jgi:hypothetical protein
VSESESCAGFFGCRSFHGCRFHTSVGMVTIEFGLCLTQRHGLRGLCGNARALLVVDLADRFV